MEQKSRRAVPSLAIAGPVKNVEERIKTIMKPNRRFFQKPTKMAFATVLLLAALAVPTALVLTVRAQDEATETDLQDPDESATGVDDEKAVPAETRVIHFPKDRSLGTVSVGELRTNDPLWWEGWQVIGPAKGDIEVPIGQAVRLDVDAEASEDISPLVALNPDDIQAMTFSFSSNSKVDDAGLAHLAGLTGLKLLGLGSTQVKGPGLAHLKELATLEYLLLGYTDIGDDSLAHISALKSLVRLNLDSTNVTDAGLSHLSRLNNLKSLNMGRGKISGEGFSPVWIS